MLRTALARGAVTRLIAGVYVNTDALRTDAEGRHLQLALAHQVLRPRMIASHHTAAMAWGLDLDDPAAMASSSAAFIAPLGEGSRSLSLPGVRITVRNLPTAHRAAHPSDLLVTSIARTAVDVASTCDLPEALITLDSAARISLAAEVGQSRVRHAYRDERRIAASRAPLLAAVEHAATQFTRRHLLDVVALADPRRESALESLSYGRMVQAGLPLPELQVCIRTPAGDYYADNLWPAHMLVGEADGLGKYDNPGSLVAEKVRQQAMEELGYGFVRWTSEQMRFRPSSTLGRIASALDARAPR
jgi:very-short-patch-repair endonuclease